jgi:hypothetical protein
MDVSIFLAVFISVGATAAAGDEARPADFPSSGRARVEARADDALGRLVDVVPVALNGGGGSILWGGNEGTARKIGAGVYFARLEGSPGTRAAKIVCVK